MYSYYGTGNASSNYGNPQSAALHNSFRAMQSASAAAPGFDDMTRTVAQQRSISDSVLSRGRTYNFGSVNTVNMMVNRSGGSAVKKMIETIQLRCMEKETKDSVTQEDQMDTETNHLTDVEAPEEECAVLAQCAVDSYYKVVIAGRGGIPAIVRAMACFPFHRGLVECCCLALSNLCGGSGNNVHLIDSAGGVTQVIAAMRNHPQSVAIQSAACDALRNMSDLILQQAAISATPTAPPEDSSMRLEDIDNNLADPVALNDQVDQLVSVLSHAKDMYLLPSHRSTASALLEAIVATRGGSNMHTP